MIYGVTGSGKTTLAENLSEKLGLPWHSMDDLTFEEAWTPVPLEEQRRRVAAICEGSEWIIDTAYGNWLDIPLQRVELIVALDYPRWFSFLRLFRRSILRILDQKTICNGNRESIRLLFSKDSILLWHGKAFPRKRERIIKWCSDDGGPKVVRLTSHRESARWIDGLSSKRL